MESMEIDPMTAPVGIPTKVNVSGVIDLSSDDLIAFVNSKASAPLSDAVRVEWIDDNHCNLVFSSETESAGFLELGSSGFEGAMGDERQLGYNDACTLIIRQGTDHDVKNPTRTWRESVYYKRKLEEKGINPDTFKSNKVILKPREGVKAPAKSSKVQLIPRRLIQEAKQVVFGSNAFSKNKSKTHQPMIIDEHELAKRNDRAKRFGGQ